jgi:hypothetical protein
MKRRSDGFFDQTTQNRAGLPRLCQGDDAARTCGNAQAARASLGAQAAGRTKRHRISKWRAKPISKRARETAWEQSRFCKEFRVLSAGWGARIRTWEWRNQNPSNSARRSMSFLKKSRNLRPFRSIPDSECGERFCPPIRHRAPPTLPIREVSWLPGKLPCVAGFRSCRRAPLWVLAGNRRPFWQAVSTTKISETAVAETRSNACAMALSTTSQNTPPRGRISRIANCDGHQ